MLNNHFYFCIGKEQKNTERQHHQQKKMLDVIKPLTDENTFKHIEPIKQTSNILIFIKYEYLSRGGDPGEELYDIKTTEETTIKHIKDELNKSFIFGELDPDQYEIYKGGEQ